MSEISNEVVTLSHDTLGSEIEALTTGRTGIYSSVKVESFADKLVTAKALTDSQAVADNLNKPITVKNIIIQPVDMTNETTGAIERQPRIIFLDDKGNGFHCISNPIFRDVKNWFALLGTPDVWEGPIMVQFSREGSGTNKYFVVKLVG